MADSRSTVDPGRLSPQGVPYSDLKHFVNADGQYIYCKYWEPTSVDSDVPVTRALLFIAHGMGEHCERYDRIAEHYNQTGVLVFAHDHIGHGKSEGTRLDIKDFQYFIRDSQQHIDIMREKYKDLPLFLFGHSMGGTIATLVAYERPSLVENTGVILSSPAFKTNPEIVTPFKVMLGRIIASVYPQCPMGKLDTTGLSRDKEVVRDYNADPLVYHGSIKARFILQLIAAMQLIIDGLCDVRWPFLLQHGDTDALTEISGSRLMYDTSPSNDKKFTVYEGFYHELDKEPGDDGLTVIKEVVDWVKERLPTSQ